MNRLKNTSWVLLLAALLLASTAWAEEPVLVTEVEGITEYRLDNGLRMLLMPDASRPTTTVNVTYFVGSKHEGYGETGMAHLLEHLLFFGTENFSDIKREISERGGFANGTTWWERTNYFQTLPADEENLEWALKMESDRMVNALLRKEDLDSEMTVVRNEFEIGESNPFRVLLQRVMATAYEWHGYGRSTIGARADVENMPIERLRKFYQKYYQPDNAMVIISGQFETERALELVQEHFGSIAKPERGLDTKLWETYTREQYQDGPREVTVHRSGTVPTLMAAFHIPSALHDDFAAVEALSFVLGDTPSGRLHKALVEPGLASQVGSFVFRLPEPSLMLLFANLPAEADVDEVREVMLQTIEAVKTNPPTEEEVSRAVAAMTSAMERGLNDSGQVGIALSEWAATGDWRMLFLHRDRLEQVTTEAVTTAASTYLVRDNRTLGQFIPEDEPQRVEIPPVPDADELLAGYTGREDRVAGEAFEPSPENIENRVIRFELANGTEVALLPKSTRGERVRGVMTARMGNLDALMGLGAAPGATSSMLSRGSENYTRQQISDRLDALQASVNIGGGATVLSASIDTRRENLMAVIDLVAELAKQPTFPETELEEYKRQVLTGIDQQQDNPTSMASMALNRHLNTYPPEHPEYSPSLEESRERVEALTTDQLHAFHDRFYGMGPGSTIAFVGDFDPDELRDKLEEQFGDWNRQETFERFDRPHRPVPAERLVVQMDDKANAFLLGSQPYAMRQDHPDYPALQLAGHLMGGGFLSSRLSNRIRNEEGLSYSVGGNFSAGAIDENGSFFVFAAFAPENRDRLEAVLADELNQVITGGFTEEEFESGRTGFLQQMVLSRSDDASLASLLANGLYLDRDLYYTAEMEQKLADLTLEEVNDAVRRWLNPDELSVAIAGDFTVEASDDEGDAE